MKLDLKRYTPMLSFIGFFLLFVAFFASPEIGKAIIINKNAGAILVPTILSVIGYAFLAVEPIFRIKEKKRGDVALLILLGALTGISIYFFVIHGIVKKNADYYEYLNNTTENKTIFPYLNLVRYIFTLLTFLVYAIESYYVEKKTKFHKIYSYVLLGIVLCVILLSGISRLNSHAYLLLTSVSKNSSLSDISTYIYFNYNFFSQTQLKNVFDFWQMNDEYNEVAVKGISCFLAYFSLFTYILSIGALMLWKGISIVEDFFIQEQKQPVKGGKK